MSEICSILRTRLASVRNMSHISDMTMVEPDTDLRSRVLARIESKPDEVWTPGDFADLGGRAAVDKTLQRLATADELRRIDRGLYDRPRANSLTGRATVPDYRAVIRAVTRRDRARVVIDGIRVRKHHLAKIVGERLPHGNVMLPERHFAQVECAPNRLPESARAQQRNTGDCGGGPRRDGGGNCRAE